MQPELLKYLLDIESIIGEIESLKQRVEDNYVQFSGLSYYKGLWSVI